MAASQEKTVFTESNQNFNFWLSKRFVYTSLICEAKQRADQLYYCPASVFFFFFFQKAGFPMTWLKESAMKKSFILISRRILKMNILIRLLLLHCSDLSKNVDHYGLL